MNVSTNLRYHVFLWCLFIHEKFVDLKSHFSLNLSRKLLLFLLLNLSSLLEEEGNWNRQGDEWWRVEAVEDSLALVRIDVKKTTKGISFPHKRESTGRDKRDVSKWIALNTRLEFASSLVLSIRWLFFRLSVVDTRNKREGPVDALLFQEGLSYCCWCIQAIELPDEMNGLSFFRLLLMVSVSVFLSVCEGFVEKMMMMEDEEEDGQNEGIGLRDEGWIELSCNLRSTRREEENFRRSNHFDDTREEDLFLVWILWRKKE